MSWTLAAEATAPSDDRQGKRHAQKVRAKAVKAARKDREAAGKALREQRLYAPAGDTLGNRVTSLFVHLPVAEENPLSRYIRTLDHAEADKSGTQARVGQPPQGFLDPRRSPGAGTLSTSRSNSGRRSAASGADDVYTPRVARWISPSVPRTSS